MKKEDLENQIKIEFKDNLLENFNDSIVEIIGNKTKIYYFDNMKHVYIVRALLNRNANIEQFKYLFNFAKKSFEAKGLNYPIYVGYKSIGILQESMYGPDYDIRFTHFTPKVELFIWHD